MRKIIFGSTINKLKRDISRHRRPLPRLLANNKRGLVVLFAAVVLLPLSFLVLSASASVTVDTSATSLATADSFQRKTWYDGSRYWAAFYSGSAIEFWYSSDGTSWTQNTSATLAINTHDFSIEADSSNAFIIYATPSGDVYAHKASSYPSASFIWGMSTLIMNSGGVAPFSKVFLNKLTDDKLQATAEGDDGSTLYARTSSFANDISSWDLLNSLAAGSLGYISSTAPLANGESYAVWANSTSLKGKKYTLTSGFSQGPNNTSSAVNDTSTGSFAWSNPGNVSADDGAFANVISMISPDTTQYLKTTGFNFSIPNGSIITGIKVDVHKQQTDIGFIDDNAVHLVRNGTIDTSSNAANAALVASWPDSVTNPGYTTYGSNTDQWGVNWTVSDINSSGFGFAISAKATDGNPADAEIDHIRITVYYSTGAWDGAETSVGTVSSGEQYAPQMVSNTANDEAYLTYVNGSGQLTFQKYIDGSGWQTALTLDSNSGNAYPTITRNSVNGDLHVFWIRGNTVYYKKGVSPYGSGNWDTTEKTLESVGTNVWASSAKTNSSEPFLTWTSGTANPYSVKFAKVSANSAPAAPTLLTPTSYDTGLSSTPQFQLSSTDADGDYLRYQIVVYQSDCSTIVRTIDQTASQAGWSGQNADSGNAFTSGSTAVHNFQTPELAPGSSYCWKARAIDPGGSNTWSDYSAARTFYTVVVFPTTGILDDFNRVNESPLGNSSSGATWSNTDLFGGSCQLKLIANEAQAGTTCSNIYHQYLTSNSYGPNSAVYATVKSLQASDIETFSLYSRLTSPGTTSVKGYKVEVYANKIMIYRIHSSSTAVWLGTMNKTISANDAVGFAVKGASSPVSIEVWHKPSGQPWSLVGIISDAFSVTPPTDNTPYLSAGKLGLEIYEDAGAATSIVDDFGGGTFNNPPVAPSLTSPADDATGVSKTPQFQLSTTDVENNYLQYQIIVYQSDCSTIVRTIDQTASQAGWSGQDANGGTAYAPGSSAVHNYQLPTLDSSTTYCWKARAIDPGGSNTWGAYTSLISFTTTAGSSPGTSELIQPIDGAVGVRGYPLFKLRASDADFDYLNYKIEICSTSDCSTIVRTIDQTASQAGWSGQDANGGTAYASDPNSNNSTVASYLLQPPGLAANTQYWWRTYSIDPGGSNIWGSASAIHSFTITGVTNVQIRGGAQIRGGGWIY